MQQQVAHFKIKIKSHLRDLILDFSLVRVYIIYNKSHKRDK